MYCEGFMRRLWVSDNWDKYVPSDSRTGIRLRFDKNVDPEVRRACKQFVNWLREQYCFPVRVPIYFKSSKTVRACNGEEVSATFFGTFDMDYEPYIRVSVGDYYDMLEKSDRDDALAAILASVTHELSHYFQWIKFHEEWSNPDEKAEAFFERQALYYSDAIVFDDYAAEVDHP